MHESWKQKISSAHIALVAPTKDLSTLRSVAGILKKKRKSLERYYEKTRKQWVPDT